MWRESTLQGETRGAAIAAQAQALSMQGEYRRLAAIALAVLALHGFAAISLSRRGLDAPQVAVPYRLPLRVHLVTEKSATPAMALVTAAAHGDTEHAVRRHEAPANHVSKRSDTHVAPVPAPTPRPSRKPPAETDAPAALSREAEAHTTSAVPSSQERQPEHRTPEAPVHEPDTAPLFDAAYLHNPAPEYPAIALQRRWEGTVLLNVYVLANGSAREVKVIASSGHDLLDAAAMQAVADWHFVPAHRAGQAIDAWVRVPLIFKAA